MPHIELKNNNNLVIAFENKRIRLGYTTTTSAVFKAISLFMEMEEPAYLAKHKHISEQEARSSVDNVLGEIHGSDCVCALCEVRYNITDEMKALMDRDGDITIE